MPTDTDEVVTAGAAASSDPEPFDGGRAVEATTDVVTIVEAVVVVDEVDVAEPDAFCEATFGATVADGTSASATAVVGGDGVCDSADTIVEVVGATVGVVVVAGGGEAAAVVQSELFNGLGG